VSPSRPAARWKSARQPGVARRRATLTGDEPVRPDVDTDISVNRSHAARPRVSHRAGVRQSLRARSERVHRASCERKRAT
jgi:hypothetical protein